MGKSIGTLQSVEIDQGSFRTSIPTCQLNSRRTARKQDQTYSVVLCSSQGETQFSASGDTEVVCHDLVIGKEGVGSVHYPQTG
jgi:hypothetical protein